MIFISGIHGVGKTFFCNLVKERLGIKSYSASKLIADKKKSGFTLDKLVTDIDENQLYLLEAIKDLRSNTGDFLLDGHFCLLNQDGIITRIPVSTFTMLAPDLIILLTEEPSIIVKRRKERDNINYLISDIKEFQDKEIEYAKEVSELLNIPLIISTGSDDIESIIDFIQGRGAQYGG